MDQLAPLVFPGAASVLLKARIAAVPGLRLAMKKLGDCLMGKRVGRFFEEFRRTQNLHHDGFLVFGVMDDERADLLGVIIRTF